MATGRSEPPGGLSLGAEGGSGMEETVGFGRRPTLGVAEVAGTEAAASGLARPELECLSCLLAVCFVFPSTYVRVLLLKPPTVGPPSQKRVLPALCLPPPIWLPRGWIHRDHITRSAYQAQTCVVPRSCDPVPVFPRYSRPAAPRSLRCLVRCDGQPLLRVTWSLKLFLHIFYVFTPFGSHQPL